METGKAGDGDGGRTEEELDDFFLLYYSVFLEVYSCLGCGIDDLGVELVSG